MITDQQNPPAFETTLEGNHVSCQDFRQRNAADFVLRAAMDLVPEPIGGSAWCLSDSRLHYVTSIDHDRKHLASIGRYLSSIVAHLHAPLEPVALSRVDGLFASALLVPVPKPGSQPCGYLLLASSQDTALKGHMDGMAKRLAQQLGQFWGGLTG